MVAIPYLNSTKLPIKLAARNIIVPISQLVIQYLKGVSQRLAPFFIFPKFIQIRAISTDSLLSRLFMTVRKEFSTVYLTRCI